MMARGEASGAVVEVSTDGRSWRPVARTTFENDAAAGTPRSLRDTRYAFVANTILPGVEVVAYRLHFGADWTGNRMLLRAWDGSWMSISIEASTGLDPVDVGNVEHAYDGVAIRPVG